MACLRSRYASCSQEEHELLGRLVLTEMHSPVVQIPCPKKQVCTNFKFVDRLTVLALL